MVAYLLQDPEAGWALGDVRTETPPLEESSITSTVLAVEELARYGVRGHDSSADDAIEKARAWLFNVHAKNQEDRNFRLRGLLRLKSERLLVDRTLAEILDAQREDGDGPRG